MKYFYSFIKESKKNCLCFLIRTEIIERIFAFYVIVCQKEKIKNFI